MKNLAWTLFILILLVLGIMQSGCGSRRSQVNIQKDSDKNVEKTTDKGEVTKESSTKEESKASEQAAKVNEKQEQRITELYSENGTLKSRITELINSRDTDNSKKEESRSYLTKLRVDSNFYTTVYKDRTITKCIKEKSVKTSNVAFYVVIGVLGAIALLFGYLYIKVRCKLTDQVKKPLESMF